MTFFGQCLVCGAKDEPGPSACQPMFPTGDTAIGLGAAHLIVHIYCDLSGRDKRPTLISLMAKSPLSACNLGTRHVPAIKTQCSRDKAYVNEDSENTSLCLNTQRSVEKTLKVEQQNMFSKSGFRLCTRREIKPESECGNPFKNSAVDFLFSGLQSVQLCFSIFLSAFIKPPESLWEKNTMQINVSGNIQRNRKKRGDCKPPTQDNFPAHKYNMKNTQSGRYTGQASFSNTWITG